MKAVFFNERRDYELAEREVPTAAPGQALLEIELCGICGTDLHAPQLEDLFLDPVVLGHEFTARVAALGEGVEEVAVGDRVVVNPIGVTCGECAACRAGLTNMCELALGSGCVGVGRDGGMAEMVALDAGYLHRIPSELTPEIGAWTEPLAVAVRGVRRGRVSVGDRVAVLGAGPIGQLTMQVAIVSGAAEVLVVDPSSHRRAVACGSGAAAAISPDEASVHGLGFDVVFDCSGAVAALDGAVALARQGGRVLVIGTYPEPPTFANAAKAHFNEIDLSFSLCYQDEGEFTAAIDLLRRDKIDVASLTTSIEPIDGCIEAIAAMRSPEETIKILLRP